LAEERDFRDSVRQPGLAGALSDVLAGGVADPDVESASVWPVEEPDPASGFDSSPRRRRSTVVTPAPSPAIMPEVIIKTVPGPETVVTKYKEKEGCKGGEGCPDCMDCHKMVKEIMEDMRCPPPVDCSKMTAGNAANAAAASSAANAAARAAMAKAASLPSPEALASYELMKQAMQAAADSRDYAQRAFARAQASKYAVDDLREDLWKAAAARAAELEKVRVVPPSVPIVF